MSYIRGTCNPESLYVFGNVGGTHAFSWTDRRGEMQQLHIPSHDFCEFFERFFKWELDEHEIEDETFEYKGIRLRTVVYDEDSNHILTNEEARERKNRALDKWGNINHLVCLTYKDFPPLLLWRVTWDCFRNSAYDHFFYPNRFVRMVNKLFGYQPWR